MKDPLRKNGAQASWLLAAGIFLSLLLVWFAEVQYRQALPVAEENLRGLSLSLSAAVEALAAKDPTLLSLRNFATRDLAYFALLDRTGKILFHTNKNLIGSRVSDQRYTPVFATAETAAVRTMLGTGEEIYESNVPVHSQGQVLALRLALHTYRSDAVIRRARANVLVAFSLLVIAWVMGVLLYRFSRRAEVHRQEMSRRERFAQLGEMGAALAHEIRNPLSGIKGYAQLLLEDPHCPGGGTPAALIVEESLRLERLVNDLLSYVRTRPLPESPVQVAEVLRCCLGMVARDAEKQSVRVSAELNEDLLAMGARDELEQVFLNLLRNALQAMPEGGSLQVRLQRGRGSVLVELRDTGHGIPVEDRTRIFTPFMTTRARGTGLGLAISRKIIEEWGGSIRVADSSPRGTTLEVTLPLYRKG
jgi:two-component system sensor histidine kinase HydH